ncbi:MAG TPA: PEP-CTERM sorting domain-containing protein [Tepidisphaeraceae bacterium]|nr:PEP-CTERM sorting domain-containing protein [Tepidisphaeraceae bacterium]
MMDFACMSLLRHPLGAGGHLSGRKIAVVLTIVLACRRTEALGDWTVAEGQDSIVSIGVGSTAGFVGGDSQLHTIPSSGALNYASEAAGVASIFAISGNEFTNSVAASRVLEIGPDGSDVGYASVLDNIWLDVSDSPSSAAIGVVMSNSDPQSEVGFQWQLVAPDGQLLDVDQDSIEGVGALGAPPAIVSLPSNGTYWLEFRWWLEENTSAQSSADAADTAYSASATFSAVEIPEPGAALGLCGLAIAALSRRRRHSRCV